MADDLRYYRVSPRFWARAAQKGWDDDTKLLAFYLLTGPHRTTEGLYRLPHKYAEADMEWSRERFAEGLAELVADGFCEYDEDAQVVLIVGAMKYQACANPNVAKAAVRRLSELPETRLKQRFADLAKQFDKHLSEQLPEGFGEPLGEPRTRTRTRTKAPSPGESRPDGRNSQAAESGAVDAADDGAPDPVEESFEEFWEAYPSRNGKKVGKKNALIEWRKLNEDQRRRALIGAMNLAASDTFPKDAERFLRRPKGGRGDWPFDDWQTPAVPPSSSGGSVLGDGAYREVAS